MPQHRVLYTGKDPASRQAVSLLEIAGFEVEVQQVQPEHGRAVTYGLPSLFALSGCFSGLREIGIFVDNALQLHEPKENYPA